jgi:hypothetical protein
MQKHVVLPRILRQGARQTQNFNTSLSGKRMQSVVCVKKVCHAEPFSHLGGRFQVASPRASDYVATDGENLLAVRSLDQFVARTGYTVG